MTPLWKSDKANSVAVVDMGCRQLFRKEVAEALSNLSFIILPSSRLGIGRHKLGTRANVHGFFEEKVHPQIEFVCESRTHLRR